MVVTLRKSKCGAAGSGTHSTLRALYEDARREVMADPAAAVRKYQPTWSIASPVAKPMPKVHRTLKIVR